MYPERYESTSVSPCRMAGCARSLPDGGRWHATRSGQLRFKPERPLMVKALPTELIDECKAVTGNLFDRESTGQLDGSSITAQVDEHKRNALPANREGVLKLRPSSQLTMRGSTGVPAAEAQKRGHRRR